MSALHRRLGRALDLTDVERGHLDRLQARAAETVPARRTVLRQGARHETAYLVTSGWLAEHRTLRDGGRQILNIRLEGDLVGVDGLAYAKAIFATSTLTEAELVPVSLDAFERLQREAPRLGAVLLLRTLRTEALLREWEVNLGRRAGPKRFAHLLLELCERQHSRGGGRLPRIPLPLTQQELADCLGVTAEHVNRMVRRLREAGVARMEDGHLVVEDEDALRAEAAFDPTYIGEDG